VGKTFYYSEFLSQNVVCVDILNDEGDLLCHCFRYFQNFRGGNFQILVATDVAARGLDVPEVDLVIQCEPPKVGGRGWLGSDDEYE